MRERLAQTLNGVPLHLAGTNETLEEIKQGVFKLGKIRILW
jgi:hypothetical protein